jgi:hypothetical protein
MAKVVCVLAKVDVCMCVYVYIQIYIHASQHVGVFPKKAADIMVIQQQQKIGLMNTHLCYLEAFFSVQHQLEHGLLQRLPAGHHVN